MTEPRLTTAATLPTRRAASQKAASFTESVIREMTRLVAQQGGTAVNLAQGLPEFP